jgi:hypothetical protein
VSCFSNCFEFLREEKEDVLCYGSIFSGERQWVGRIGGRRVRGWPRDVDDMANGEGNGGKKSDEQCGSHVEKCGPLHIPLSFGSSYTFSSVCLIRRRDDE